MVTDIKPTASLPDLVANELRARIEKIGSAKKVAEELEIPQSMITEILKGRRMASPTIAEKLGFVRITFHVKRDRVLQVIHLLKMALEEDAHFQRLLDKVLEK